MPIPSREGITYQNDGPTPVSGTPKLPQYKIPSQGSPEWEEYYYGLKNIDYDRLQAYRQEYENRLRAALLPQLQMAERNIYQNYISRGIGNSSMLSSAIAKIRDDYESYIKERGNKFYDEILSREQQAREAAAEKFKEMTSKGQWNWLSLSSDIIKADEENQKAIEQGLQNIGYGPKSTREWTIGYNPPKEWSLATLYASRKLPFVQLRSPYQLNPYSQRIASLMLPNIYGRGGLYV